MRYIALSRDVLVVAVKGEVNDWAAYIGAVSGDNHDEEYEEVARHGTKIPKWMAERLFPDLAVRLRWRE